MGKNSRLRRAAKQRTKQRQERQRPDVPPPSLRPPTHEAPPPPLPPPTREAVERVLSDAVYVGRYGNRTAMDAQLDGLRAVDHVYPSLVGQVAVPWLERLVRLGWESGWQPRDLAEYARRKLDPSVQQVLPAAIAVEHHRYPSAGIDPRWRDQVADIGAEAWLPASGPQLAHWAERWDVSHWDAVRMLVSFAAFLVTLPRLPRLLPIPGDAPARSRPAQAAHVDDKILSRIRGLLAKAESTEFPEEAEALSSKAQEMMTKYSLDRALLEAGSDTGDVTAGASARRIWVDAPYVSAKNQLVHVVARVNGCKSVSYDQLGFITVLGSEGDLGLVELLSTSLLVQASRAMLRTSRQVDRFGQSRTRSYRYSFLLSYANRIGERLREARRGSEAGVDDADRERLLPVLARRDDQVEALFTELFPTTSTRRTSVSNHAGWAAGRAAADQASLQTRPQVRQA